MASHPTAELDPHNPSRIRIRNRGAIVMMLDRPSALDLLASLSHLLQDLEDEGQIR